MDTTGPPQLPERDPRSYTPKHLAEKILRSKSALEGERKQVTVLFADVKGSMELAEQVDPEEWHQIMDRFFKILNDGVHRYEGTVNQYTGDGIMALFGAPIAHEDHAQRACYAALHLREELRRYADELRVGRGLSFSTRMGINSGEVVVGKIGDDLRMDYTAQGQTVGLAARMEELAEPGKVLLTARAADLTAGYFELRDLGASQIKGVSDPLHLFELEDVGRIRTRLDVSRARGFSKFVGRTDEMTTLELAFNRATEGNGQVVGVVGEAGVGKSRLCLEFLEQCRARDIRVLEAHCPSHGKTVPLLPILELLRNAFGITAQDRDQATREKIAGRLLLLDLASEEVLPLVFDFLGVPDPERPAPRMDPEARQRQLYSFVRRLVQARSEREPAVLLFDDIQWIDSGSDGFLAQLVEATSSTRTMLLVNFRPEYQAEWIGRSYYQQLPLSPLGPEAIGELLHELLGDDPTLADLRDLINERTGGNPFFIEEVTQSLAESGSLEGARGSYRLVQPIEALQIPPAVQVVLAARIDRLGELEKRVLQTASVIGKQFSELLLQRVVELPEADLVAAISSLRNAEFIYEQALYPATEYAFKHPLTQEVAYGSQLGEPRARIHERVAQAIEERFPEKLDEQAAVLARHWEEAGELLQAARWHARAAGWAGTSDPAESVRHWQKVRALTESFSETEEASSLQLLAFVQGLNLGWRLGLSEDEWEALFAEGKALAERRGDTRAAAFLLGLHGNRMALSGNATAAVEHQMEAVRLSDESGDLEMRCLTRLGLAYARFCAGRLPEALKAADHALDLTREDLTMGITTVGFSAFIWLLQFRGLTESWMGRLDQARRDSDRAIELARESENAENLGWALGVCVYQARFSGEVRNERGQVFQALEIAEKLGSPFSLTTALRSLGILQLLHEEWLEAIHALGQSLEIGRSRSIYQEHDGGVLALLAMGYLGAGQVERARRTAEEAIRVARRGGALHYELEAQLYLARVLMASEGAAARPAIEESLGRALGLVGETGAKGLEPQIIEARAELAHLLGDDAAREHHLHEAHRLYTEMGATGHAERLARELGL